MNSPGSPIASITCRSRLTLGKKAAFALCATALFFASAESLLAIFGIVPLWNREDLLVGFSGSSPLFVGETQPDGTVTCVTASNKLPWFNAQRFPQLKAAGTKRVFCLGGSTTYGHPYADSTSFSGWLREFLPAADQQQKWEVVNCGGISYASYRIVRLMQELADYSPDLFVVYTGHNEFLERRTYAPLLDQPAWLRSLTALLSRTRTFTALHQILKPQATAGREVLSAEVDAILDKTAGPADYSRNDPLKQRTLQHFRQNLHRMAEIARGCGARIIFVTPPSNVKDCSPFKSEVNDTLSPADRLRFTELFEQGLESGRQNKPSRAKQFFREAVNLADRHAAANYHFAKACLAESEFEEARRFLNRALEEDICPLRALGEIVVAVRDVARAEDAPLVDFAAQLEELSQQETGQRMLGSEYFLDHVHPTIRCHRLLALSLIENLQSQGLTVAGPEWNQSTRDRIARQVEGRLDAKQQALCLKNLAKTLSWAGKQDEAGPLAEQALAGLPGDSECLYMVGVYHRSQGDSQRAAGDYRLAIEIDPNSPRSHLNLANILVEQGDIAEAISHFQTALKLDPRNSQGETGLATALAHLDRSDAAIVHFRKAIFLDPNNAVAEHGLAVELALQGRFEPALEHYQRALRLRPAYPEALYNLGNALRQLKRFEEAERSYRRALLLTPEDPPTLINLGVTLKEMGSLNEAARQFEQAIAADDTSAAAWAGLANIHDLLGDDARAVIEFRRALKLKPGWPPACLELARVLAASPDPMVRNPVEAIQLAEELNAATHGRIAEVGEVLAAAYAAAEQSGKYRNDRPQGGNASSTSSGKSPSASRADAR